MEKKKTLHLPYVVSYHHQQGASWQSWPLQRSQLSASQWVIWMGTAPTKSRQQHESLTSVWGRVQCSYMCHPIHSRIKYWAPTCTSYRCKHLELFNEQDSPKCMLLWGQTICSSIHHSLIYPAVPLPIHPSIKSQSIHPSIIHSLIYPSIPLPLHPFIMNLFINPSTHPSITHSFIYLFIWIGAAHSFIQLSTHPFIQLSTHPYNHPFLHSFSNMCYLPTMHVLGMQK